jgi:hypothetical protein
MIYTKISAGFTAACALLRYRSRRCRSRSKLGRIYFAVKLGGVPSKPKKLGELSVRNIVGPWVEPNFKSGLIDRCRKIWDKPIQSLTNWELATLLEQRIAVPHVLPVAKARIEQGIKDNTELFDGQLRQDVEKASEKQ